MGDVHQLNEVLIREIYDTVVDTQARVDAHDAYLKSLIVGQKLLRSQLKRLEEQNDKPVTTDLPRQLELDLEGLDDPTSDKPWSLY